MSDTNLDTALLVRGVLPLQQWLDKDTALLDVAKSNLSSSGDVVQYLQDVEHANDLRDKLNHLLSLVCGSTAVFFDHIEVDSGSLVVNDSVGTLVKEAIEFKEAKEVTNVKDISVDASSEVDSIRLPEIVNTIDEVTDSTDEDTIDIDYGSTDEVNDSDVSDEAQDHTNPDLDESEDEYEKPMMTSSEFDPEAAANKDDETADVLSDITLNSPVDQLDGVGVIVSDMWMNDELILDDTSTEDTEPSVDVASMAGSTLLSSDEENEAAADFSEGVLGGSGDSYQESDYDDDDNGEVVVDPNSF